MTASAPPAPEADDQAPAPRALIERQLWVLGRLAEAGLNVALAIERQATAAAPPHAAEAPEAAEPPATPAPGPVVQGDVALAYARASRAVRLTVALQARLIKDLQALDEAAVRLRRGEQVEAERERQTLETARKARVERIVERVIRAELSDEDEVDRLAEAAWERLDHDEIYGDLLAQPVGEIIARVCRDLGLSPDWSRLAEEAWAREEIDSGALGSPFLALSWPEPSQTRPDRAAAADPPVAAPQAASP
ncbi:hypothetical protein LJR219_000959 [Phenylobacterium sp. LjRoot219]|uniref:hypothetical protein n=1 Tax=Phenylobacterium sp. LjRoot219 TaxID=3342283 RepID=UPI003ED131F9